jgi:hypothetical protein
LEVLLVYNDLLVAVMLIKDYFKIEVDWILYPGADEVDLVS